MIPFPLEALYREHFIDEWIIGGVEDYRNCYELPAELQLPTDRQFDIERLYTNLQRQALAEAAWTAPPEQPAPTRPQIPTAPPQSTYSEPYGPSRPYARPGPKIGRNDPCPCGSGRKYKKCHGKSQ